MTRPIVLCILDGWGISADETANAIAMAETPHWDRMMAECPHALLDTSGEAVGLPAGQMGNSEVGHMNLGGGRIVLQDLPRIDSAIEAGELPDNAVLKTMIDKIKAAGGVLHIMGLMSPGGVHSHQDHMVALARAAAKAGVPVRVHAFLDGRDTPPRSAIDFIARFEANIEDLAEAEVATVAGRYYAMDRDKRWDRTEKAYDSLVDAKGRHAADAEAAIRASYDDDVSDEFMLPAVIGDYAGMRDGDGFIMANFRADRAREILTALIDPGFDGFVRNRIVDFAAVAGMVAYSTELDAFIPALFPPEEVRNTLGEVVARAGLSQLRIAETEKYAHVTFFFNGGEEKQFENEERILVPSPKVATYDLQPEMSAIEVTDKLVEAIESGRFDVVICNYANPDMVGHTGNLEAAIKAAETVDACLGRLRAAVEAAGGDLLITADHGNLEFMKDPKTGQAHTAHTTNPVPIVLAGRDTATVSALQKGRLADVAPTILTLLGLAIPEEMTGRPLIKNGLAHGANERRATA